MTLSNLNLINEDYFSQPETPATNRAKSEADALRQDELNRKKSTSQMFML